MPALQKKHYSLTNNRQINENKLVIILIQKSSCTEISMVITSIIILILLLESDKSWISPLSFFFFPAAVLVKSPPCDAMDPSMDDDFARFLEEVETACQRVSTWAMKKKGPYSCLGYIGDYTQLCGDYNKPL